MDWNEKLAYAAGIVDGEGSLTISVQKSSDAALGYRTIPSYQMSMKDSKESRLIQDLFKDIEIGRASCRERV